MGGRQVAMSRRSVRAFLYEQGGICETRQGGAQNQERAIHATTAPNGVIPTHYPRPAAFFFIIWG